MYCVTGEWPGLEPVTTCLELLGWLVASIPGDSGQPWGSLQVLSALEPKHKLFCDTLLRALLHNGAEVPPCAVPNILTPDDEESTAGNCWHQRDALDTKSQGRSTQDNSDAINSCSKAAATFLSLLVAAVLQYDTGHVTAAAENSTSLREQLSLLLSVPVTLYANNTALPRPVTPGYEICRRLILLLATSTTTTSTTTAHHHDIPPLTDAAPHSNRNIINKQQKNHNSKQQRRISGNYRNNKNKSKQKQQLLKTNRSSDDIKLEHELLEPVYLECLAMVLLVCDSGRCACYHHIATLLPSILAPIQQLPVTLNERAIHFTTNLVNRKVSPV